MNAVSRALLVICLSVALPLAARADTPPPAGTIIVAKSGESALILWDATPAVAAIVTANTPRDEALKTLESQTVGIASSKAATLTAAKTITVRVIYEKSGDVSPIYKTATFAGVVRVVTVTMPKANLAAKAASFAADLATGKTPPDVTVVRTGDLPPP